jgi:hypothetical protein
MIHFHRRDPSDLALGKPSSLGPPLPLLVPRLGLAEEEEEEEEERARAYLASAQSLIRVCVLGGWEGKGRGGEEGERVGGRGGRGVELGRQECAQRSVSSRVERHKGEESTGRGAGGGLRQKFRVEEFGLRALCINPHFSACAPSPQPLNFRVEGFGWGTLVLGAWFRGLFAVLSPMPQTLRA